jgi:hypothetical protein
VPVCPVPPDQLPINEYQDLQESWFFHWATLPLAPYLKRIGYLWSGFWLVTGPVAASSFAPQDFPLRFGLMAAIGASALLGLVLTRLYLGWAYVHGRLLNPTVIYEETGWYDGGAWPKPVEELNKDQLIATYQVAPTLVRLRHSLMIVAGLAVGSGLVWLGLASVSGVF